MLTRLLALIVMLCVISPAVGDDRLISGDVTYRERMALPTGSTLHIGLVTLPNGEAVVGAGASIPSGGQVPIQFSLAIRSDLAASDRSLGIVAEIRKGTQVLFRNAAAVPVDLTLDQPVHVVVTRQDIDLAEPEPIVDEALVGVIWHVTSIGGSPVSGARPVTLSIAPDLRAGGHAGCNDYFTQATIEGAKVQFGVTAATRKACTPELMTQEGQFFAALGAVNGYERTDDSLRLLDAAGVPLIGLVRTGE
ncbi:META domain-containing protein [Devosia soli]|uniref:META domain-containing protein n=1 Tax=Devosia soli TaxID=361041 RepID=UPI000A5732DD|nr:META domain-containing protein [Devosia soli]